MLAVGANLLSAIVALATLVSYAVVYTPLKRRSSFSTVIGAIPGALPPVIGWAAALDELSQGAWVLFGIVFLWQLPHFLAIAWIYREDYARAGFPMLPVIEPDGRSTARQAVIYCTGAPAAQPGADGYRHDRRCLLRRRAGADAGVPRRSPSGSALPRSVADARRLFFGSIIYLPLLWMLMIANRAIVRAVRLEPDAAT